MSGFDDYMYEEMAYASTLNPCGAGRRCLNYTARGTKCSKCSDPAPAPTVSSNSSKPVDPNRSVFENFIEGRYGESLNKTGGSLLEGVVLKSRFPDRDIFRSDAEIQQEATGQGPEFISTMFKKPGKSPYDFSNFDWNQLTTNPAVYMPIIVGVGAFFLFIMLVK